jgi:uncharacterized protein (TIGR02147 family)
MLSVKRGVESVPSIYQFDDYLPFLETVRGSLRRRRPLTYAEWAETLGYRSPRAVAMVLKGQRLPSVEMLDRIGRQLKLSPREVRYLELLVLKRRHERRGLSTSSLQAELKLLNRGPYFQRLIARDVVPFLSNWYHVVIKQLLASSADFESPARLYEKLRRKVPLAKIEASLRTLVRLGFFVRDPRSGKLVAREGNLETAYDVPDEAVRNHHRGMLHRAIEALDERPVPEREFTTLTFRADPAQMDKMKKRIREFRYQFDQEFECLESSHVFQLNLQLFEHTE